MRLQRHSTGAATTRQGPATSTVRVTCWILVYFVVAVAPLPLGLIQLDPGRGFWVNFSVALGFVGLALLGLQFVLVARSVRVMGDVGPEVLLKFHRQLSYVILALIVAHPVILFIWDSRYLQLLNLVAAPVRAKVAVIAVLLTLVLIASSVWRQRIRLSYPIWQLMHAVLALVIVATALSHVLLVGYYVREPWEQGLWAAYSVAFIWMSVWVRVVKPVQRWRRRWRVTDVTEQPGRSHTVTLEPAHPPTRGRGGFRFEPGQFAWIIAGRSPFALTYHPFSFSSSAERPDRVEFTVKELGKFSSGVADLTTGQHVYLDGPWGHLSLDRHTGPGVVLIGGGIGVTPLLSMLKTMADRGDRRQCLIILANNSASDITGHEDIEELRERLNLVVVYVLSAPPPDWQGERGRVDAELLRRHLPEPREQLQYFVCGPDPMMTAVEQALDSLGVPAQQVHSERFATV